MCISTRAAQNLLICKKLFYSLSQQNFLFRNVSERLPIFIAAFWQYLKIFLPLFWFLKASEKGNLPDLGYCLKIFFKVVFRVFLHLFCFGTLPEIFILLLLCFLTLKVLLPTGSCVSLNNPFRWCSLQCKFIECCAVGSILKTMVFGLWNFQAPSFFFFFFFLLSRGFFLGRNRQKRA